jgi:hypothetical protein
MWESVLSEFCLTQHVRQKSSKVVPAALAYTAVFGEPLEQNQKSCRS